VESVIFGPLCGTEALQRCAQCGGGGGGSGGGKAPAESLYAGSLVCLVCGNRSAIWGHQDECKSYKAVCMSTQQVHNGWCSGDDSVHGLMKHGHLRKYVL
jgi:hypothetical protein